MINLFVIDDHPMFIDGIRSIFEDGTERIKVTGSANSAKEALPKLRKSQARVILLDLIMPDMRGVEFSLILKKEFPDKKIIVLTGELSPTVLFNTWANDVDAILLKYCGRKELIETIHDVIAGRRVLGKDVPKFQHQFGSTVGGKPRLTPSEQRVLNLLAQGYTRKDVGKMLGTSENAVDFHCNNLFKKFNNNKLVSIIEEARKENLI
ncbi:MAG: response regulator transcription factor [Bacteroidales bacterium]|nr:response regulator transcription factor [Bacteroidales bacterium]